MLVEFEHPTEGPWPQVGLPVRLADHPGGLRTPAPGLGQHTRAYLAEVGYGDEEIAALIRDGVAAEPSPSVPGRP
jgi:crotonobetainyl-CoA:carnitine CoA-transferase CaiB-like acyl-CoA transferase